MMKSSRAFCLFLLWLLPSVGAQSNGSAYDEEEGRRFASLASVTYCSDLEHVMDWSCQSCKDSKTALVPGKIVVVDGGKDNATRVLVGKLKDQRGCLMAFRGSYNLENWIRDFQFWDIAPTAFHGCTGCTVHSGFYAIWENVRALVLAALRNVGCSSTGSDPDNIIYVTGHSLGAALTHLSMFDLDNEGFKVAKTYSYEAPRIGNKAFSDEFSERFTRKFPVYRMTHYMDPVVHLPPVLFGYTHVQSEVYYNKTGGYKLCPNVEDKSCADQYDDLAITLLHAGDHCSNPLVPNGDICNPIGCAASQQPYTIV